MFYFSKFFKIINFLFLTLIIAGLSSCDSQVGNTPESNSNVPQIKSIKKQQALNKMQPMNIKWSFDGRLQFEDLDTQMHDTAWHVLTATVTDIDASIPPTAVDGLIYEVEQPKNYGQDFEMQDINCKSAVFAKVGDSCGVYFRIKYDQEQFPDVDKIPFYIIIAPNGNVAGQTQIMTALRKNDYKTIAEYRSVLPLETKYYAGSAVNSNKNLYQILLVNNNKPTNINITKISAPLNPIFSLMHRASAESSDAYYAGFKECSLTNNTELNQTNHLDSIDDQCILVYEVNVDSTNATESTSINIATDAEFYYPDWPKIFNLVANYVQGTPIPQQDKYGAIFQVASGNAHPDGTSMVMDTDGVLTSGVLTPSYNPFKLVDISYQFATPYTGYSFTPPYGIPFYQNGTMSINNQSNPGLTPGTQIITDASSTNPVTVGQVRQLVTSQSSTATSGSASTCGGAHASANASISTSVDLTNQGLVHLHVTGRANASCQNWRENTIDENIPLNGYSKTVFSQDDQGCGGGTWDIGGVVTIDGNGCNGDNCLYMLHIHSHHGGDCWGDDYRDFPLNFMRPQVYTELSGLSNFNLAKSTPDTLALAGQTLNATLGTEGGLVAQNINYQNEGKLWVVDGLYSNGLSSTNMSYNIGLRAGNTLKFGSVNFTRSSGYDLADFTITQAEPSKKLNANKLSTH